MYVGLDVRVFLAVFVVFVVDLAFGIDPLGRPDGDRLKVGHMAITMEQARQRLLDLLAQHDGYVPIEMIEDDEDFAENRETVSAAARALVTDPDIIGGQETHPDEHWFPYSFLMRSTS
jgi:hypothetical protein